jgi:hypothetical protein
MLLGLGSTAQGYVSLLFSFHLYYFSDLSEYILPNELSQIFAPIPGGGHELLGRRDLFRKRPSLLGSIHCHIESPWSLRWIHLHPPLLRQLFLRYYNG